MSELRQIREQIARLSPAERDQILWELLYERRPHLLAYWNAPRSGVPRLKSFRPDFPSIVKTPGICGGAARLIRTRIPVWTLERMRQLGLTDAQILESFPTLRAVDLVEAWAYAQAHTKEIERAIHENEEPSTDDREEAPAASTARSQKSRRKKGNE